MICSRRTRSIKRLRGGDRNLLQRRFAHAHIDILQHVLDIAAVAPIVMQELNQHGLQRQDLAHEPGLDFGRTHGFTLTAQVSAFTARFRNFDHLPSASLPAKALGYMD